MDRIADYTFVRSLGEGNHGEFFLARTPARLPVDDEYVAVKVLASPTSEDTFRRATRELRVFASVRSPYVVTLYDAGQEGGLFYYSMEYFPLGSLASPSRPLERGEALRAVSNAARAAHALHESGVVHRDIKPANIMLHEGGAKLSDLGLVQVLAPGQSVTGMGPIGSVEFMHPALMRGENASRASDIWSLGVTLHRALTGEGLYGELPDKDPLLAIRKVLTTEPTFSPNLDPRDAEIVRRATSLDPAQAYATAEVLADQLDSVA